MAIGRRCATSERPTPFNLLNFVPFMLPSYVIPVTAEPAGCPLVTEIVTICARVISAPHPARLARPLLSEETMVSPVTRSAVSLALAIPLMIGSLAAQSEESSLQSSHFAPRVVFSTSCAPDAQPLLEQGVAALHTFQFAVADSAFVQVADRDSTCLIAAWGRAMVLRADPYVGVSSDSSLQAGWSLLAEEINRSSGTSRERDYLDALIAFFRDFDKLDHQTRALTYEVKMRDLAQRYPGDLEAQVLWLQAASANASFGDSTLERRRVIGTGLQSLHAEHPEHPGIVHYLTRVYDHPELASLGVEAARQFATIASGAFTAQHLPSHLYRRVGKWNEVVQANLAALDVAVHSKDSVHAKDFLVYAYLQYGDDEEARSIAKKSLTSSQSTSDAQSVLTGIDRYALAAIPVRYALERRDWALAAVLPPPTSDATGPAEAMTHFARALGAARTGDVEVTRTEFEQLLAVERSLPENGDWRRITQARRLAVSAWVALAEGDTTNALLLAAEAADREDGVETDPEVPGPIASARELLGDLLVEVGRYDDARVAYQVVLEQQPNRARSVFGAAWAAQLAGDHEEAADGYRRFLALMEDGNGDRPELAVAKAYVQAYAQTR